MGTRAFSHDSIFIPDGGAESEQTVQATSQDNILGKVKTLQQQLGRNIKFGQPPPNTIPMKKADSGDAGLEEDLFLTSPIEIVTHQDLVPSDTENKSSDTPTSLSPLTLSGAGNEMEEKVGPVKPARPKRHLSSAGTIESVNLDAIPLAIARLDNSAAKHKLSVKPKKQRVSKKHRRLVLDGQNEHAGLERQPPLDQNGHPGEDKHMWLEEEPEPLEEEPEPLDSEEEKRRQEEYWQELEAKCKRQKAEAAERRRLEEQRLQALERRLLEEEAGEPGERKEPGLAPEEVAARTRQLERPRRAELGGPGAENRESADKELPEAEEQRRRPNEDEALWLEAQRRREEEERCGAELRRQEAEKLLEEERKLQEREAQRKRAEEEAEQRRQEQLEAQRLQEEEEQRKREEAQRKREEEEEVEQRQRRRLQEEEDRRAAEQRRQEELERQEEARRQEELRQQADLEAQRRTEAEKKPQDAPQRQDEDQRGGQDNARLRKPRAGPKEPGPGPQPATKLQGKRGRAHTPGDDHHACPETREEPKLEVAPTGEGHTEERPALMEQQEMVTPEAEQKVEELRWREVDERQTMPRPYTFQVSSGGKQILFPKVNLSPVTPGKDAGLVPTSLEPKAQQTSSAPPALPSALSIPHTAILVTGAQLCGPAVNLSQIQDTACKSLLGLSEEKQPVELPAGESPPRAPGDPRAGGGKARPPQDASSSSTALAEWASIRSRILKNAESELRPGEEPPPRGRSDSQGNLRKTPPANAKFSIMPAWQKFSEGGPETAKQNAEAAEGGRRRSGPRPTEETEPPPTPTTPVEAPEPRKSPEKGGVPQEPTDTTEGCKFAKDLPSFLVPSLPSPPQRAVTQTEPLSTSESQSPSGTRKSDHTGATGGEEKASPFGIKLRRTNYSLRFHCDQLTEQKKKKKHSCSGDSADGGPPAPEGTSPSGETGTEGVALKHGSPLAQERKQTLATRKDSAEPLSQHCPPAALPGPLPSNGQSPGADHNKVANKMLLLQKPALAPKPTSQTPPSSPLSKLSRPYLVELLARRAAKPDPEPREKAQESHDTRTPLTPPPGERKGQKRGEEEEVPQRKKPSSPALPTAGQEKLSQTPEAGRKEKPLLLSRHSLDGSKLTERAEAAQPLWITLALQKQKGFREQQATREEKKQAREARQAEKLSKDGVSASSQPESTGRAGPLHRSAAPAAEEMKPAETAVSRLERREQLKKASTLPTSVTVEISDSTPHSPLVKEVPKRFSTPDAAPVSTEPAWLALAKRKAKAWSDCPQIIK
ncbi:capping protein-inhibiting regulator of actin dynamics [Tenrec ecaudatus]|uniref:capping protein-inhibiting regulator of actin dynamics n=1 Tax=Tenrec ecaudatus TaxID=94439 RepID=UPI003F599C5B